MTTAAATQAWTWIFLFVVSLILGLVLLFKFGTRHRRPAPPAELDYLFLLRQNLPTLQLPYLWESFYDSKSGQKLLHLRILNDRNVEAQFVSHQEDITGALHWARHEYNTRFGGITEHGVQL
jgi:hypothetical protein